MRCGPSVTTRTTAPSPTSRLLESCSSCSTSSDGEASPNVTSSGNPRMPDLTNEEFSALFRTMLRIRFFEERASVLYRDGEIPGFVHLSIGQEASAVGVCSALSLEDGIVSNHRGHGHCIAKGVPLHSMFAELMGRGTGACGGLGGSMHIADVQRGIYGANGIVAAGLPIACGVAASMKQRGQGGVVAAFFGDGAVAQGAFHESLNLASIWKLPVIFVCENNGFSEMSPAATQHPVPVVARAAAYGMRGATVDGNDVEAVAVMMGELVDDARRDDHGPALLECVTYRFHGHYEGDPERYRDRAEVDEWRLRDPIELATRRMTERGFDVSEIDRIVAEVRDECEHAENAARADPSPTIDDARAALYAPRRIVDEPDAIATGEIFKQMDAVHDALRKAMSDDDAVWIAGIDVAAAGNVFGVTRGLAEEFPGRVLDSPISETALVGVAVGAAMAGSKPVVEVMYLDFIGVCFDQLLNQAAKIRFMTGGRLDVALVVRTQFGAGRSSGAQHSQSLEALLAHVPGLTVVMPSTPADAYGLLRAAIADPNPVIVIEHRLLYGMKGDKPPADHIVPIGKAIVRRPGTDVTVVSWSRMVHVSLQVADELAAEGVSCEVIDMRTVAPLDIDLVAESVQRTGRVVVVHEAVLNGGVGAEIVAQITNRCFWHLDAPPVRVATEFLPAPYATSAEAEWLISPDRVRAGIRAAVDA